VLQIICHYWQCICYFWSLARNAMTLINDQAGHEIEITAGAVSKLKFQACEVSDYYYIRPVGAFFSGSSALPV
jgi:hypothetical protein